MSQSRGGVKVIAQNSSRKNYVLEHTFEAGLCLQGSEVKSLRESNCSIRDAYLEVNAKSKNGFEAYLLGMHIAPFKYAHQFNHEESRKRKLLLKKSELNRIFGWINLKGMTAIALKIYFKGAWAKVEIGIVRGRKKADQRERHSEREDQKEMKNYFKKDLNEK